MKACSNCFLLFSMGGLGIHNVRMKALASLIRTFLETAANPSFNRNIFHSILYRVNVLDDDSISNPPPLPPYYPPSFFNLIKQVKETTPLNVVTMSLADWYRLLVEMKITMVEAEDGTREYIKSRAETASPETDWEVSWRRARLKGLGSEATSFLWKVLHRLLPSEERLSRILPNSSSNCKQCPEQIQMQTCNSVSSSVSAPGRWGPSCSTWSSSMIPMSLKRRSFG